MGSEMCIRDRYSFDVDETVSVGDTLFASVGVRDLDTGLNGIVDITCDTNLSPEACEVFEIKTQVADLVRNLLIPSKLTVIILSTINNLL